MQPELEATAFNTFNTLVCDVKKKGRWLERTISQNGTDRREGDSKVKKKGDEDKKIGLSVFNLPKFTHRHTAWQAAGGADGARSEGSRRPAASVNQCHALEPHLSGEACCWYSVSPASGCLLTVTVSGLKWWYTLLNLKGDFPLRCKAATHRLSKCTKAPR